jgi:hypothetical protein
MARPTTPSNAYESIFLMPREPASCIVQDHDTVGSHDPHDHKGWQLFFISSSFPQRRDSSAPVLPNASTLTMSPTKHIGLEADSLPVQIFQSIRFLLFVHLR